VIRLRQVPGLSWRTSRRRRAEEASLLASAAALAPNARVALHVIDAAKPVRARIARSLARFSPRRRAEARRSMRTARAWVALLEGLGFGDVRAVRRRLPLSAWTTVTAAPPIRTWHLADLAEDDVPAVELTGRCAGCASLRRRVALRAPGGTLLRCRDCGLVSVEPLPTLAVALAQYDGAYFRGDHGYRDYAAEEANYRATFRRRLQRIRGFGGAGRLLDVGAATGAFLLEARQARFDVAGLEPVDSIAEAARKRGLDVRTGSIESLASSLDVFDVVTAFDVVEHLVDPLGGLRALASAVRGGGLLVVTVPDFGGLWARASGRRWPFITPPEHLHYFTRRSLRGALRTVGLDVLEVSTVSTPLSFGTLARKAAGALARPLERLLGPLADRGGALPFGTLMAVARRGQSA
jgi:SAM-dependent methyltransferase